MEWIDFEEVKRSVKIVDVLSHHGIFPIKKGGGYWLYRSPFRKDNNASLSVQLEQNRWKDHAEYGSHSVIDLAMALGHGSTSYEAAMYLQRNYGGMGMDLSNDIHSQQPTAMNHPTREIVEVVVLRNQTLLRYLEQERKIPASIAQQYCCEVHYRDAGSTTEKYAIGFRNIRGGYELRNSIIKGSISPKDITILPGRDRSGCMVFEGFIDFLSLVTMEGRGPFDAMILNSVSNVVKAIDYMGVYTQIECYLDNDMAGRRAHDTLAQAFPSNRESNNKQLIDRSGLYEGYCDLNDCLTGKPVTNNSKR